MQQSRPEGDTFLWFISDWLWPWIKCCVCIAKIQLSNMGCGENVHDCSEMVLWVPVGGGGAFWRAIEKLK